MTGIWLDCFLALQNRRKQTIAPMRATPNKQLITINAVLEEGAMVVIGPEKWKKIIQQRDEQLDSK